MTILSQRADPALAPANDARRKLLVIAQLPPPVHGAALMNQRLVSSELVEQCYTVEVLPIKATENLDEIRKFQMKKVLVSLGLLGTLAGRLRRFKPDVVYLSLSPSGLGFVRDLLITLMLRTAGIRHVFFLHVKGITRTAAGNPLMHGLYRWVFGKAGVIQHSPRLYPDIQRYVDERRIRFVPNGIEDPGTWPRPARAADGRVPTILFLSNMMESKGPLVLLDALALLKRRGVAFRADFAGAWRGAVQPDSMQRMVADRKLDDAVRLHGPVYGSDKTALLRDADIFAFPTYYPGETFSLVVIEAMASGLPAVTTDEGALADLVVDGQTGLIVPSRDPSALADALERLIRESDLRAMLGRAARARFEQHYTVQHFERALVAALWDFSSDRASPLSAPPRT